MKILDDNYNFSQKIEKKIGEKARETTKVHQHILLFIVIFAIAFLMYLCFVFFHIKYIDNPIKEKKDEIILTESCEKKYSFNYHLLKKDSTFSLQENAYFISPISKSSLVSILDEGGYTLNYIIVKDPEDNNEIYIFIGGYPRNKMTNVIEYKSFDKNVLSSPIKDSATTWYAFLENGDGKISDYDRTRLAVMLDQNEPIITGVQFGGYMSDGSETDWRDMYNFFEEYDYREGMLIDDVGRSAGKNYKRCYSVLAK
ncbi:MAG: hypothetical protein WC752_01975 [Patescibacteria group bacterium]|jgi:hypothetical protein